MELKGRLALVTGAAQGIGRAIAEKLAGDGADVYLLDYNVEKVKQTAEELAKKTGARCIGVFCDVSDVKGAGALCKEIIEKEKHVDILVNNAGITQRMDVLDITEDVWDRTFDINLRGAFFLTQAVFGHMKENRRGVIVNMTSLSAERGARFSSVAYTTSKGGVLAMTKCLALLGGEYGVRVNAVAPGIIDTAMTAVLNSNIDDVPLGRIGTPEDVAEAVRFLCSDRSSYLTGQVIDVNGGQLMR